MPQRGKRPFFSQKNKNFFAFAEIFFEAQFFRNIFCAAVKERNKTVIVKFDTCAESISVARWSWPLQNISKLAIYSINKFSGGKLKAVNKT
jgi:hypothetical protein